MSKSKQIIILSFISILLFTFAIMISCTKKGTESSAIFEPGTFLGTYSVEKFVNMSVVNEVDTVVFDFSTSGNRFTMKLDTTLYKGQSRDFCDVTGEYSISGNRMEIEITTTHSQICNPLEIPEDRYTYYGRSGEIVFDGLDDNNQDLDRQIILWLPEE